MNKLRSAMSVYFMRGIISSEGNRIITRGGEDTYIILVVYRGSTFLMNAHITLQISVCSADRIRKCTALDSFMSIITISRAIPKEFCLFRLKLLHDIVYEILISKIYLVNVSPQCFSLLLHESKILRVSH